jgi:[acyl-carrier-protein] S-malonyltransferase
MAIENQLAIGNRQSAIAYLFPGQGSQYAGMGKDLAENSPAAGEVFEEADRVLGVSLSKLCFGGTVEELQLTENTQPAILTVSVAAWVVMETLGLPKPDYVAGHSLGEYSALVAAGSLSFSDAVKAVRLRGRYMQEAVPMGVGAMAAVMGMSLVDIKQACAKAGAGQVCAPANINSANQVVIAGNVEAIDRAIELLKKAGARRVVKLNVSAPFHCALMMTAQERLAANLVELEFGNLLTPLVTNVDAALIDNGRAARDALIRQVSSPVRWLESIELLISKGVDTFVEVGPGKVLTGLMRQVSRAVKCFNVEDMASLEATRAGLV